MKNLLKSRILLFVLTLCLVLANTSLFVGAVDDNETNKVVFEGSNGNIHYANVHKPPIDFNPLTASDKELEYYCFPQRPKDTQLLKDWKEVVSGGEWVKPTFEIKTPLLKATNNVQSENWSGFVKNAINTSVSGNWQIPSVSAPSQYRPAYACEWVGLGGDYSGYPLAQIGTNSYINTSGTAVYDAWWQIIGTSINEPYQVSISSITCSANNNMYASVYVTGWNPQTGAGTINFYLKNTSTNIYTSFSYSVTGASGILSTAEWILERPETTGTYYFPYTGDGDVHFWGCCYTPSGGSSTALYDSSDVDAEVLWSPGYANVLASPGVLNSGTFKVFWNNYN